jgi:hypothetical protein
MPLSFLRISFTLVFLWPGGYPLPGLTRLPVGDGA